MHVKFRYIWINNFSESVRVKPHSHTCCEIIFYEEADGHSNLYDIVSHLNNSKNSDILYTPTDTMSSFKRLNFENSTVIFFKNGLIHDEVHKKPAKLVALGFELNSGLPIKNNAIALNDENSIIKYLIDKIVQENQNGTKLYKEAIENYISLIMIEILRLSNIEIDTHNPIYDAYSYLSNYYFTKIDYDNLAELSGYSTGHFRQLFKQEFGVSPKRFVLNKRFEHSKKLIKDDLPLDEVAYLCGYDDYPQFSTFFKKFSGVSPMKYKSNLMK